MDEKEYVLEKPILPAPPANAPKAVKDVYEKHVKDDNQVSCVMLATMITELQKQHEDMKAHEMIVALRQLYQGQSRHERFLVSKALFSCKLSSGNPVGPHILKMIGYITNLEKLGFSLQRELATDLILQSLPELYKGFVMNYMMHDLDKPLPELLKMLQTAEENLTKGKGDSVLMVQGGKGKPKKGIKIKARTVGKPKSKSTSSATQKPIGGVAKGKCHHCGKAGNWRRTCKTYLATKKKEGTTISSEVYVIEVNMSISSSWVLDTGCGSHICTTMQGLKQSRRLARGEIELRVGNGAPVAALAIGTYSLVLPSGLMLELNDCFPKLQPLAHLWKKSEDRRYWRRRNSGPNTSAAGEISLSIESKDFELSYEGHNIIISESKSGKIRHLYIAKTLAPWLIDVLSRPEYSNENWEITGYDGDSFLNVFWDSNRFGHFARLSSNLGPQHSQIFIPAGYSLEGLKIFSRGLTELLRASEGRCSQSDPLPLPYSDEGDCRKLKNDKDEGWRCCPSWVLTSERVDEDRKRPGNMLLIDSIMEQELEGAPKHTLDAEALIDKDCLKILDQVIRDNLNLFRRSVANKRFLQVLKKGEILSYSGEVIRVTREAMKSFEFIDAAIIQGAKYPVFLAYAKEDMEVVLTQLCGVQE
ncbi:unnamed protein product [Cuscuta campestris]|uniref:CCHC-type domain-containing protein n=1 Tax=Cuscuta campestris TaxID=132261 RepID=A0A484M9P7_9ASTE|nr:unnamed protein product [Cuscuta campestris]